MQSVAARARRCREVARDERGAVHRALPFLHGTVAARPRVAAPAGGDDAGRVHRRARVLRRDDAVCLMARAAHGRARVALRELLRVPAREIPRELVRRKVRCIALDEDHVGVAATAEPRHLPRRGRTAKPLRPRHGHVLVLGGGVATVARGAAEPALRVDVAHERLGGPREISAEACVAGHAAPARGRASGLGGRRDPDHESRRDGDRHRSSRGGHERPPASSA